VGTLAGSVVLEQFSPNWCQVTFLVTNSDREPLNFDVQVWTHPRMGEDSERPQVVVVNSSQGVTSFVGSAFTLQMVTRPAAGGVAQFVTPPDNFDVGMGSWGQVSLPYSGNPDATSWSWFNVRVAGRTMTRVSVVFGVGEANFPTPTAVPQPATYSLMGQGGNATFAFNLRYQRQATTTRDEGWSGLVRQSGRTSEAFFSSGVARLGDLNATVRFEQLEDAWVRLVFSVNNPLEVAVPIDLLFSCATAATTVSMMAGRVGVLSLPGFELKLIRYSSNGAPVDDLGRFSQWQDSWEGTSGSFSGVTAYVSLAWMERVVPARGVLELATVFGVGTEPVYATRKATASNVPGPSKSRSPTRSASASLTPIPGGVDPTRATGPGVSGAARAGGLSAGAWVGVAVAAVAVVALAAVAVWCFVRRGSGRPEAGDELDDELVGAKVEGLYT
jgi:hypothetical protein